MRKSQMIFSRVEGRASMLLVLFFLAVHAQALAIKPQPPLRLDLVQTPLPNGKIEVTFEALANIKIASVELLLELPKSVSLIEGEDQWTGPIGVGEKKTLTILIQSVSSLSAKIVGKSTVHLPEGDSFVQQSSIVLDREEEKEPQSGSPPIRWKQGDKTILEFRGK